MEQKDLAQLVRDSQAEDPQARERLVQAVQNYIWFYCRTMLEDEDAAMDAAQDILVAMLTGLDTLREPDAFRSWLRQIVVRACGKRMDRARRRRQREVSTFSVEPELLSSQQEPDTLLDREEVRQAVRELVKALPQQQRICVLLYYYDEMSVEEIAAALKVPLGTVKSRLYYARQAIRRGAEKYADEGLPLYGLSPLPFLQYFLRQEAAQPLGAAAAAGLAQAALTGGAAAGGAAIGAAVKSALSALAGKKAAVLAGLALAGAVAGGVLYRTPQPPVQPPVQTTRPAEEPEKHPDPPQQPQEDAAPPERTEPEVQTIPATETAVEPVPQGTHVTPPALPAQTIQPQQPSQPEEEPPLMPEELQLPPPPDFDVTPEPIPVILVAPDLDSEPEPVSPPREPEQPSIWDRPVVPVLPAPETPGPITPDPGPTEPDPPEQEEPERITQTFEDVNGNGGYGYTSTLSDVWGGQLPLETLTYSSSDPSVVSVNEKGEFTTLAPGDAVLTAVDPENPSVVYELSIHVEDCFRWEFQLPDLTYEKGQADMCVITSYQFSKLIGYDIRVEQVEWSSSDPSVARLLDTGSPISCTLCAVSPGTAEITGTVTFRLDTAAGVEMTMQDSVSFQVTVTEPPEEPAPEEPTPEEPTPEPPAPEDPKPEEPAPEEPVIHQKELTEFGVNSGYGYQSSFAQEWGEELPEGLRYSSSDEAVVKISGTTGEFYTVSGGTAELTAEGPGERYVLTVRVQDQFQWTCTVSDMELSIREMKTHGISDYTLPEGVWLLGGSWSSSEPVVTFMDRTWKTCDMMGLFPGTADVTCVVHFDLKTFEGYVRMKTEFSFQVTVLEAGLEPEPEQAEDTGETSG